MSDYIIYNGELMHYGVLGMRWGVRKAAKKQYKSDVRAAAKKMKESSDILKSKGKENDTNEIAKISKTYDSDIAKAKKNYKENKKRLMSERQSKDYKEAKALKKKHVSELSNTELRALNDRMNLEQNYKRLNPSSVQKGIRFMRSAVAVTGTVLALEANSDRLIKLGKKVIGR